MEDFEKWERLLTKLIPKTEELEAIRKKAEKPRYRYVALIGGGVFLMLLPVIVCALMQCCGLCDCPAKVNDSCKSVVLLLIIAWFALVVTLTYCIYNKWMESPSPIVDIWLERHYKFSEFVFSQVADTYKKGLDISARRSMEMTDSVCDMKKKIDEVSDKNEHQLRELGNAVDKMEINIYRKWIEQNVDEWKAANKELKDLIDDTHDSCIRAWDDMKKQIDDCCKKNEIEIHL